MYGFVPSALLFRRLRSVWLGLLGYTQGVVGFARGRSTHWGVPWGSSGSFGVPGFIRKRPGGRRVRLRSLRFIGVRPGGGRVRLGSLRSLGCALVVVGFVRGRWIHWVSPWCMSGSLGVPWFIGVRPGGRRVRSGTLGYALGDIEFVRDRWDYWG